MRSFLRNGVGRRDAAYRLSAMALAAAAIGKPAPRASAATGSAGVAGTGLEPGRFGGHVHALAVNPATQDLFLGARPIYRSSDGGKTWQAVHGVPKSEERANITSIAVDAHDPQIMYAAGHGIGVVKSVDAGRSWTAKAEGLSGTSTEALTIDARNPKRLYVWVLGDGLYRSEDAGESWRRVDDGPKGQEIRSLASVSAPTGMGGIWLYAGLDTGVVRSPDCFCGWDRLANAGLPERSRVYSLAADPARSNTLYAGLRRGVFRTVDGGRSWTHATHLVEDAVVATDPSRPGHVYAVGGDGVLVRSTDAGAHWMKVEQGDGGHS